VIVTNIDHEANIGPWQELSASGIVIKHWRMRPDARLELEDLDALLTARTRLVAFTHCSNVVGSIHDVASFSARVRAAGALSCVDGVAYAPHRRVDVRALGADFYFASLYKVYGPHLAVLHGRAAALAQLHSQNHHFVDTQRAAAQLEPGNVCYELTAGLAGIVDYLEARDREHGGAADPGSDPIAGAFALIARHEQALIAPLLEFLASHERVTLLGERRSDADLRVATIAFSVRDLHSSAIPAQLDREQLAVRFGHFYAYQAIRDLGLEECGGIVRISLVHYNTPAEVERLIAALARVLDTQ
jgi:selenocysteine lyase/cysteine desulfurase